MPATKIGFILFPRFTQLDLTGPWEVLTRLSDVECHLISSDMEPVRSDSGGLRLTPTITFEHSPQFDVLCVPGGPGHLQAMLDQTLLQFISTQAEGCRYVTAVCTGALVLAAAGLLRGYRATTHWLSIERLAAFGATPSNERVVVDRDRITGGGVTAGIDFGLRLARELRSAEEADMIRLQMEYAPEIVRGGRPDDADPQIVAALRQRTSGYAQVIEKIDGQASSRLALQS